MGKRTMERRPRFDSDQGCGRYVIDFAYSLGALWALGDEGASATLCRVQHGEKIAARLALQDQFDAGARDMRRVAGSEGSGK